MTTTSHNGELLDLLERLRCADSSASRHFDIYWVVLTTTAALGCTIDFLTRGSKPAVAAGKPHIPLAVECRGGHVCLRAVTIRALALIIGWLNLYRDDFSCP